MEKKKSCRIIPPKATMSLKVWLTVLFMFTVLAVFFLLVLSKVEKQAIETVLTSSIRDAMPGALRKADGQTNGALCLGIRNSDEVFDGLERLYAREDPTTKTYNEGLKTSMSIAWVGVTLVFVAVYTMMRLACGFCGNLPQLLAENLVIFALVGCAEYIFFTNIALRYVPVTPSYTIDRFAQSMAAIVRDGEPSNP